MADAAEWTEELVAEYFELQGYAVLRDLPTTTGAVGGRSDADVIAFRRQARRAGNRQLDVIDAEVATAYESAETIFSRLQAKFSRARRDIVMGTVSQISGQPLSNMNYRRFFFDFGWLTEDVVLADLAKKLRNDVRVVGVEQFVNAAAAAIERWKAANPTPSGGEPSLPERLPSLQVLLTCRYCWGPETIVFRPVE